MLKKYSYPNKHKDILIFKEIETKTGVIKEYIHPINTIIKAYVRQLSGNEQNSLEGVQDNAVIEFVINSRTIEVDMFIEFKNVVYGIDGTDSLEFFNTEIHLRGYPVNPKTYSETRWS